MIFASLYIVQMQQTTFRVYKTFIIHLKCKFVGMRLCVIVRSCTIIKLFNKIPKNSEKIGLRNENPILPGM